MKNIRIKLEKLKCDSSKYNSFEVEHLRGLFLSKKPIPVPYVNEKNEVIAFCSSYFVLKELGISEISAVLV